MEENDLPAFNGAPIGAAIVSGGTIAKGFIIVAFMLA